MSLSTVLTDPLQLDSFYSLRSTRQYYQSWVATLFYPKCKDVVVEKIQNRIQLGGTVVTTCKCGACKLVCEDAPRLITVCHCSVCRYDEALPLGTKNAPAPSFAAVKRSKCRMEVNTDDAKDPANILVYRNSSDFARRGRCGLCNTSLVMDYEWFEPETIWLVNPQWTPANQTDSKVVEFAFNDGKADIDVCWNSRVDPITTTANVSYLGKEEVREKVETEQDEINPRGVKQCDDLDWEEYKLDVGSM